jgi:mono/diheme cytochrome c family protein
MQMRFAFRKANNELETMKTRFFLLITILFIALSTLAAPSEEGKTIFAARCAACHNVNKVLVGPALSGVDQRRSIDWIVKFVHSPQTIIKSGDPYAVALLTKYKVQMPDHADLTEDNIKNIVDYIKAEASAVSNSARNESQTTKTDKMQTNYLNLILTNTGLLITSLALIAILIAALVFVIKVKQMQRSKNS